MRLVATLVLLGAYMAVLLRPVGPYLEYAINKGYIAAYLCENKESPELKCEGKCYLRKQIQKENQTPDQNSENMPVSGVDYEILYSHVGGKQNSFCIPDPRKTKFPLERFASLISLPQNVWTPPPQKLV